jgi:hypothetical protein
MTLVQILERAEKARVRAELKAELAKTMGEPGQVSVPRGWNAGEKLVFESLPAAVQEIIYRRRDCDIRELRRLQTTVAELRRSLNPSPLAHTERNLKNGLRQESTA